MSLERLLDTDAVINCVRNIACGADAHDWSLVADCFDRNVLVDYVSLAGGAPVHLTPEQIVDAWQGLLPGFDTTRHRLSNFRVALTGDAAECRSYLDALHVIPGARDGETWRVVGEYTHRLVRRDTGWKVAGMRFEKDFLSGNQALPEMAQARLRPRILEVEFASEESLLAGRLFLPGDWDESGSLSAVLVCGSWLSVKEQMAGLYALEMARKGFAALAFDHRGFGGSQGGPRQCEWPERKIRDCAAALDFLQCRSEIDFERIFILGLGAGAAYALCAAAGDARIKGLALVAPWLHQADALARIYGGEEQLARLLRSGHEAQRAYEAGEETARVPAAENLTVNAAMAEEFAWLRHEAIETWDETLDLQSWARWLEFDPLIPARQVAAPALLIHSPSAFFPQGAEDCFQQLTGAKTLFRVEGAQDGFYASSPLRTVCARRIADYFRNIPT